MYISSFVWVSLLDVGHFDGKFWQYSIVLKNPTFIDAHVITFLHFIIFPSEKIIQVTVGGVVS